MEHPNKVCETGIIYYDMLQDAYDMIEDEEDPAFVRDFLLSCMEVVLCDGVTSTDRGVYRAVRHYVQLVDKARERYVASQESKEQWKYVNERYEDIAKMLKEGKTQAEIAAELGISQPAVCRRIKTMKEKHPELLE